MNKAIRVLPVALAVTILIGSGCSTDNESTNVSVIQDEIVVTEQDTSTTVDTTVDDDVESGTATVTITNDTEEEQTEAGTTEQATVDVVEEAPVATYGGETEVTAENCIDDECLQFDELSIGELDSTVLAAMETALDDEYKARETYNQVIAEFGSVTPFTNIRSAEERHIAALESLFEKYGYDVPENPYTNVNLLTVDSTTEACEIGVQAEIDNAALYKDQLLPAVAEYDDITRVFTNLMDASQDKHLPAFERCATGDTETGSGSGNGSGGGNGYGGGNGGGQGNGNGHN